MALTLETEIRLKRVGLIDFYKDFNSEWFELTRHCFNFCSENFPGHSQIREDDVAKELIHLLEINEHFMDALSERKLNQKYWIRDFCDLIIDRTWPQIVAEYAGVEPEQIKKPMARAGAPAAQEKELKEKTA